MKAIEKEKKDKSLVEFLSLMGRRRRPPRPGLRRPAQDLLVGQDEALTTLGWKPMSCSYS